MIQPDKFMEVASNESLRGSGALARILAARLPSWVGIRFETENEPGLSVDEMADYNNLIRSILDR